jgi:hypothetical protein
MVRELALLEPPYRLAVLSAPDRMMGPTILQQVSHPIDLLLIGMQSCLTDPKPIRENSSGSLLPM